MRNSLFRLSVSLLILVLCLVFSCEQQAKEAKVETKAEDALQLDKIPEVVMAGLKAKFPGAEIQDWAKEKEGDIIVYDIEFKQADQKFEADIKEDGTIHNWEKEIAARDLPGAVKTATEEKYPNFNYKEIMEITAVKGGEDALEGYEIVLETAEGEEAEITVAPDGQIVEESGEEK